VFTSVTDWFTFRVSVASPVAYEPPTTEIFALVAVSERSWKVGLAAGKFAPAVTDSPVPLTEITADVGGGVGGDGGVTGGVPLPDEDPLFGVFGVDDDDDGPPAWNGSLLSKSEKDWS
jgi:hypothetical protein